MADGHVPVMLKEVLDAIDPKDGDVIVDGTFGGGGYTKAILDKADCTVIAIDRDTTAIERAKKMSQDKKIIPIHGTFSKMDEYVSDLPRGIGDQIDAVVLDIGVSSFQIDQAERGFSFMHDGPLDMRMDQTRGQTAKDLINGCEEEELADLFYQYGEERQSRKIAKAIVRRREDAKFETTKDLAVFIEGIMPKSYKDKKHPATRVFQALRIAVNDELSQLEDGLKAAESILKDNGRLVVVTFHSIEDRIVKMFFKNRTGGDEGRGSRYLPEQQKTLKNSFKQFQKKAVKVSNEEIELNNRSRSSKLRWAVRVRGEAA